MPKSISLILQIFGVLFILQNTPDSVKETAWQPTSRMLHRLAIAKDCENRDDLTVIEILLGVKKSNPCDAEIIKN